MEIIVNGAPKQTDAATAGALASELGMKRGTVLIEHNGVALRPDEWENTPLQNGDRIEMLKIVAGG